MEKLANTRRELEAVAAGQPPIVPDRARLCLIKLQLC
jgi:hypothetical protein